MKRKLRIKGKMRLYLQWPAITVFLLFVMNVWMYFVDRKAGFAMSGALVVYAILVFVLYMYSKSKIFTELMELAAQYGMLQNVLLKELSVPYAITTEDGKILWSNDSFSDVFAGELREDTYLSKYISELNRSAFPKHLHEKTEREVSYEGRDFIAQFSKIEIQDYKSVQVGLGFTANENTFVAVTLHDVTELNHYIQENEGRKLVAGLIYIDNYEEVMDSVEEVRQSLLVALIDRKVNQYMTGFDGLVKKLEKDKYFFVMRQNRFLEMQAEKFHILEDVKTVNIGNKLPVTLSMGMGLSPDAYAQSYNYARVAIDLALARGGDQAVVKRGSNITYFGGKREQTAKNTRVKARVKAEALREFIMAKDQIIVMGHKLTDVDSFGAAIGVYRAAKIMGKKVYIVLNDITSSVRPFYESFMEDNRYPDDMFIRSNQIDEIYTDNTMVIVVDTNKADMTECPELVRRAKTIVVFDHHRQGSEAIENTILSYIEPYASSACEMIAEMLQYIVDDVKITTIEANSMYAGIMIDTNNFMNRTGVRTFEAAAFLRRCGADIVHVRKLFRDNLEEYRARAEIVSTARIYHGEFAIAVCEKSDIDSPTIVGAQAANELLNIEGVKASFVLTQYNGKIYVSARSIDEVNVQIVMERMGGGGHINTAGTQFQHTDMHEAVAALKETLDEMIQGGDI